MEEGEKGGREVESRDGGRERKREREGLGTMKESTEYWLDWTRLERGHEKWSQCQVCVMRDRGAARADGLDWTLQWRTELE